MPSATSLTTANSDSSEALPTGLRTLGRDQPPTDSKLAQPSADPGFVAGCASFCVELEGASKARDGPVASAACEQRHAAVLERRRERDRSWATLEVLDRGAKLCDIVIDQPPHVSGRPRDRRDPGVETGPPVGARPGRGCKLIVARGKGDPGQAHFIGDVHRTQRQQREALRFAHPAKVCPRGGGVAGGHRNHRQ